MGFNPERRQAIHNTAQLYYFLNSVGKVSCSEMAQWEKRKAINSTALAQKELLMKFSA